MHMADALLSPAVGGIMWGASGGAIVYCSQKCRQELNDQKIPLMGVLAAFIFAAQMINFTIPGTGSSGHLGGGMLLAILLGPYAAFLAMASILAVQALFFADGGLLALGGNIFNLGFFPCFIAFPYVYKNIARTHATPGRITAAALLSVFVALQLGSLFVVLQTVLSGVSALPFTSFAAVMQPIHLAIGLVEGIVTALVVSFIYKAEPGLIELSTPARQNVSIAGKRILLILLALTIFTGGFLSWFASNHPDGLEWSITKVTGKEELEAPETRIHKVLSVIQEKFSFLPDYSYKQEQHEQLEKTGNQRSPAVDSGTSLAGIVGGLVVIVIVALVGFALRKHIQPFDYPH